MKNTLLLGVAVTGFTLALFFLERRYPLRQASRPLIGRLVVNLVYALLAFLTVALTVRPAAEAMLAWADNNTFGLLNQPMVPGPVRPVVAFFLMDLTFYWWHQANHRIPLLWRFHNVHHIDPDLDVSTAFRFHFGELAFSSAFRVFQIGLIAPSLQAYAVYEIAFQVNTLFHHSNLQLPIRIERLLNRTLVTPRMHGIHHSQVMTETNSNYGSVLPWWDRLHRSLELNIPQKEVVIGIPGYAQDEDNRLGYTLVMPFRKQREYWHATQATRSPSEKTGEPGVLAE